MLEILKFIFSSFWIWLGFTLTLVATAASVSEIAFTTIRLVKRR